jgi:hypothetical protein
MTWKIVASGPNSAFMSRTSASHRVNVVEGGQMAHALLMPGLTLHTELSRVNITLGESVLFFNFHADIVADFLCFMRCDFLWLFHANVLWAWESSRCVCGCARVLLSSTVSKIVGVRAHVVLVNYFYPLWAKFLYWLCCRLCESDGERLIVEMGDGLLSTLKYFIPQLQKSTTSWASQRCVFHETEIHTLFYWWIIMC